MGERPSQSSSAEEADWVLAARAGDRTAFDALLRPHLPALRGRVRGALRYRPDLDADEIVQETLIRSFQAFEVFDPRYRFAQYLFGIAKYALLRHMGGTRREIAVAWDETLEAGGARVSMLPAELLSDEARAIAGAQRFPRPDDHAVARAKLCELIEAVLTYGGYPHQQIVFAFGTVLWGKRKARKEAPAGGAVRQRPDKVPITSDPDRVVAELSDVPLARAGAEFRREIEALEGLAATDLDPAFESFEYRLGMTVEELFAQDVVSSRRAQPLHGHQVGNTRLADYYGRNPRKSAADWIAAVKVRTEKYLTGRLDLDRSPLPLPRGHENSPRRTVGAQGAEARPPGRRPQPSGGEEVCGNA